MAWLVLLFLLYGDSRSLNYLVPGSVYSSSLCQKTIWILRLADADGGNQTRVPSTASDRAIHYTIAPRQAFLRWKTFVWKSWAEHRSFKYLQKSNHSRLNCPWLIKMTPNLATFVSTYHNTLDSQTSKSEILLFQSYFCLRAFALCSRSMSSMSTFNNTASRERGVANQ